MLHALVEHNEARDEKGHFTGWEGYDPARAQLRRVFELEFEFDPLVGENADDYQRRACEWIFRLFNAPEDMLTSEEHGWTERYRGLRLRSLSVGDVILMSADGGSWRAWAVGPDAFAEVDPPDSMG